MAALSDSDMVTLWNECIQSIAKGQSYEINGRRMQRANLREARDMLEFYEARVVRASDVTGGIGLVSFGGP